MRELEMKKKLTNVKHVTVVPVTGIPVPEIEGLNAKPKLHQRLNSQNLIRRATIETMMMMQMALWLKTTFLKLRRD
jgi:hypothetical protein